MTPAQTEPPWTWRPSRLQRRRDAAVVLLCLTGAAASLNLFRLDMFRTIGRQNIAPVGTITFKNKTAQRRMGDRVLWDQLWQESPVYSGDTIRTAELSEAVIRFPDGTEFDLAENTIIQIGVSDDRIQVDLEGGLVNIDGGSTGKVISVGNRRVEAAPGAVLSVQSGEDAGLSAGAGGGGMVLRVSEGNVLLIGDDGESREAAAGTVMILDSAGLERVEPAAVVLAPRPNVRLLNPRQEPLDIAFSWNSVNLPPYTPLRLEIAEDRNFSRIAQTIETIASAARVPLPSGLWHWRIMYNNAALAAGRITVVYMPAPSLITPFEGQEFSYRSRQPTLRFRWADSADADSWILEAADNPAFGNPQIRTEADTPSLTTSELGAGLWYWRVLPVYSGKFEGTPLYSNTASFTIRQNGLLAAPRPVFPDSGATVNIAAERGDAYFSWQSEDEAASYTIRIATDQNLQNPVISRTVREAFFVYTSREQVLGAGQYYWGVSQTDSQGNESPVSPARPFTALAGEMIQRAVFPPDNFTVAETLLPETRFTWKSNLPLETRFQISDRADFSRLAVDEIASGESIQGRSLPPGLWYWRVSAEGEMNGQNRVFQTPPRSFIAAPVFPAPLLVEPAPEEQVVVGPGEPVVFRWQPVSGAEYYQFRVYAEADRSRPVYEQNFTPDTEQSLVLPNFSDGAYYWTVQAFSREGTAASRRASLIGGERFIMRRLRPPLPEAQGLLPADGHIVGPAELRQNRSLAFNWQPVAGANAYIFTLFGETDGRRIIRIGPQGRTSVTLEDLSLLDRGAFVWQVEALSIASGGEIEQRGRIGESRFTVDIPLPQPVRGGTGTLYGK